MTAPLRLVDGDDSQWDPESEYIAACLTAGAWDPVADGLKADDFLIHRRVFRWITRHVEQAGKPPSLDEVVRRYPSVGTEGADCERQWALQQMFEYRYTGAMAVRAQELVDALSDANADEVSKVVATMFEDSNRIGPAAYTASFGTSADDVSFVELVDEEVMFKTHSESLNEFLGGGIRKGQYVLIGARLSTGKSFWMMRTALTAAMQGVETAYLSLEMSKSQCLHRLWRMMLTDLGVPFDRRWSDKERVEKYRWALAHHKGASKLKIFDPTDGAIGPSFVSRVASKFDAVFVDYAGLLMSDDVTTDSNDWRAAAAISSALQRAAKRYNVPVVTAVQLNRDGKGIISRSASGAYDPTPGVDKIAITDALGQGADVVLIAERQSETVTANIIAKNRTGSTNGVWFTSFDPMLSDFDDLTVAQAEQRIAADRAQAEGSRPI